MIRKYYYGNYSTFEANINTLAVQIGKLTLFFSYEDIIAFKFEDIRKVLKENEITELIKKRLISLAYDPRLFISKNFGSPLSPLKAKHLNRLNDNQSIRIDREVFVELLNRVLDYCNLSLNI